jgi:4-amino-4-deoxy-L-arabinose transferase-like glycosyltransferase
MKFNISNSMLIISLIMGIFFRFYQLGEIPVSLYWDEAAMGVDAHAVSIWGKDMHGNPAIQSMYPSYGDYKLPGYILLDSIVVKLFGLSPWSVRLPSALAGVGLLLLVYLINRELFKNRLIASLSALIFALLPMDILFSRTGFEGHLATFFVALSIYLWLVSVRKPYLLLFAPLASAMAVYTYFSARIVVPLIGVATFLMLFKATSNKWKIAFLGSIGLWLVLLIPIYNSPFYEPSNQFRLSTANLLDTGQFALESNVYREQSGNSIISRVVYHRYLLQVKAITSNIFDHFDPGYLFIHGDSNLRHSTGTVGILYFWFIPGFVIGGLLLAKKNPTIALWLLAIWVSSILPAAIPTETPHALRSMSSSIVFAPIIAYGMYHVFRRVPQLGLIISILILIEVMLIAHDYQRHYPARSANSWQNGYSQLADYLKLHRHEYDQAVIDYPDNRLYLYFLFANRTSPEVIAAASNNFTVDSFDGYYFGPTEQIETEAITWLVVGKSRWDEMGQPEATLIYSNSEALFAVIKEI